VANTVDKNADGENLSTVLTARLSKLQKILLVSALAGRETKYRGWCDYDYRQAQWQHFGIPKRVTKWDRLRNRKLPSKIDNARKSLWRAAYRLQERGLALKDSSGIRLSEQGVKVAEFLITHPEHQAFYQSELTRMHEENAHFAEIEQRLMQALKR
jgi:hypothetical protein